MAAYISNGTVGGSAAHTNADTALRVTGLSKRYPGFALENVTFSIEPGHIVGFIGRNGAGKSTTLKCLEGAVHPDGGDIEFFGTPFHGNEERLKSLVGFEIGGADFYKTKRLGAIAKTTKRFYRDWDDGTYERHCRQFNLDQGKRVADLSQGMRVKFSLALALSHRSRLLILDEPTSGLDPASREEVLDILLTLARDQGTSVLFSTHITSDLDKCADDILYLREGRLVGTGPLAQFKARYAVTPLETARDAGANILGTRRCASGDTALVPASAGVGTPASLEDIMTHA